MKTQKKSKLVVLVCCFLVISLCLINLNTPKSLTQTHASHRKFQYNTQSRFYRKVVDKYDNNNVLFEGYIGNGQNHQKFDSAKEFINQKEKVLHYDKSNLSTIHNVEVTKVNHDIAKLTFEQFQANNKIFDFYINKIWILKTLNESHLKKEQNDQVLSLVGAAPIGSTKSLDLANDKIVHFREFNASFEQISIYLMGIGTVFFFLGIGWNTYNLIKHRQKRRARAIKRKQLEIASRNNVNLR